MDLGTEYLPETLLDGWIPFFHEIFTLFVVLMMAMGWRKLPNRCGLKSSITVQEGWDLVAAKGRSMSHKIGKIHADPRQKARQVTGWNMYETHWQEQSSFIYLLHLVRCNVWRPPALHQRTIRKKLVWWRACVLQTWVLHVITEWVKYCKTMQRPLWPHWCVHPGNDHFHDKIT